MKKTFITLFATVFTIASLHAFRHFQNSSISGKVLPPEGAETVFFMSTGDSARTTILNGSFTINVKPGSWKIVVDAKEPFKDAVLEKVDVKEGQNTDVGEIRLQQ